MSDFDAAVAVVLRHEGDLSDDAGDPGGLTHHGITLPVLREEGAAGDVDRDGDVDLDDIRELTPAQARAIYRRQWWDRYGYGDIRNQAVATKVFDLAVVMGPRQAHLVAQRALRACGSDVREDGLLGPVTKMMLNRYAALELMPALRSEAAGVFRTIVRGKPELSAFLKGWLNRAYE
jgi:lysozyme family protein